MLVVRVELHSAITRTVTEIARMHICNLGGSDAIADYGVRTLHGRCALKLDEHKASRHGTVTNYPRKRLHVWNLVARALRSMDYK